MLPFPPVTDGDLDRALILLEDGVTWSDHEHTQDFFRQRDVYDVAEELGFQRSQGQEIWNKLVKAGRIVRSVRPINKTPDTTKRIRFYWVRTPNSPT